MRAWLTALVTALVLVLPVAAWAQTVTLQSSGITRVNADGSMVTTKSSTNMNVFTFVNASNCYGNDQKGIEYAFPISVANETMASAHHIEVWAGGSDCTPLTARSGTTPTCWPATGASYPPNSVVQTIRVRAQDIASQISATTKVLTYTAATSAACTSTTTLSTITIYFLLLDGSGNPVGTGAAWPMKVKLVGPPAPNPVSVSGVNQGLEVSWDSTSSQQDTDLAGFKVYFDTGGTSDASTTTSDASGTLVTTCADGGVDDSGDAADGGCTTVIVYEGGGGNSGGTCSSSLNGANPNLLTPYATAPGKASTHTTVNGLTNGSTYSVAVAAYDAYDNSGPLTDVACASPEPIVDFWQRYRDAGGTAGGLCALEAPGGPATGAAMTIGLAVAALMFVQRRRRK